VSFGLKRAVGPAVSFPPFKFIFFFFWLASLHGSGPCFILTGRPSPSSFAFFFKACYSLFQFPAWPLFYLDLAARPFFCTRSGPCPCVACTFAQDDKSTFSFPPFFNKSLKCPLFSGLPTTVRSVVVWVFCWPFIFLTSPIGFLPVPPWKSLLLWWGGRFDWTFFFFLSFFFF